MEKDATPTLNVTDRAETPLLPDFATGIDDSENLSPECRLKVYDCDQLNLFADLENEEEMPEEFQDGGHYAADIGEIIKNRKYFLLYCCPYTYQYLMFSGPAILLLAKLVLEIFLWHGWFMNGLRQGRKTFVLSRSLKKPKLNVACHLMNLKWVFRHKF